MIKPFNLGDEDYYSAMASPRWAVVRQQVFDRDDGKCRICGCKENLQCHHIRYQNDSGENDFFNKRWLVTLCRPCHKILSESIKEAKDMKIEMPVSVRMSQSYAMDRKMEIALNRAFYAAEKKHTVETFFQLWKRSLREDCERKNFRDIKTLKSFERIIIDSLMYQADWPRVYSDDGPAYIAELQSRITEHIAEDYNREMAEGLSYESFKSAYKLNDAQMSKVIRNAQRLTKYGFIYGNRGQQDGKAE